MYQNIVNKDSKPSSSLIFATKAENLKQLSGVIKNAKILPFMYFSVDEWLRSKNNILRKLQTEGFLEQILVVRSSAITEDSIDSSQAGKFLSILNVLGVENLENAINKVISSYDSGNGFNQVLIQPKLQNVKISGVVFGYDPNTTGPYFVINYDDYSGKTDSVTSGSMMGLKTHIQQHSCRVETSAFKEKIFSLVRELAELYGTYYLDIEFAYDDCENLYLFQVRPLIVKNKNRVCSIHHSKLLRQISRKIEDYMKPQPYLHGEKTIFGIMPDWNPAEMIGVRPKPLALSLYRDLITDSIWAYQRDNYGYRNLRGFPLLVDFVGLPYIDVRVCFNSFIPKTLTATIANKLINYYIKKLDGCPSLHDKVEFEIVFSSYTFDLKDRLEILKQQNLSDNECEEIFLALVSLTKNIIDNKTGLWQEDLKKIENLQERRKVLYSSSLDEVSKMYWLLEDCKRYGTLPFAGLARAGFISVQILKSMVSVGILSQAQYHEFIGSTNTVASQMQTDLYGLSRESFMEKYGHLRPGTYDVMSPRYDEAPDLYFDWQKIAADRHNKKNEKKDNFSLSLPQLQKIRTCLSQDNLEVDVIDLMHFMKASIEAREYAKFVFTRNVSDFLKMLTAYCLNLGIPKDDIAYININDILSLYSTSNDIAGVLYSSIEQGKMSYQNTHIISLPPVIASVNEIWSFELPENQPNYVTQRNYQGKVVKATVDNIQFLNNSIVLIENADPGYDWIFSHGIGGLITMYGGVNSHMAIRAGEVGIPAAIGVGTVLYSKLLQSPIVTLDCANKRILCMHEYE